MTILLVLSILIVFGSAIWLVRERKKIQLFNAALKQAKNEKIYIKNYESLQKIKRAKTIIFTRSGVLAENQYTLEKIIPISNLEIEAIKRLVLALAKEYSAHPISQAVIKNLNEIKPKKIQKFAYIQGRGMRATMEYLRVFLGSSRFLSENKIYLRKAKKQALPYYISGKTVVYLSVGEEAKAILVFSKKWDNSALKAMDLIKNQNFETILLTGDSKAAASYLCKKMNLDSACAKLDRAEKIEIIQGLQNGSSDCLVVSSDELLLAQAETSVFISPEKSLNYTDAHIENISQLPVLLNLRK